MVGRSLLFRLTRILVAIQIFGSALELNRKVVPFEKTERLKRLNVRHAQIMIGSSVIERNMSSAIHDSLMGISAHD